MSQWLKLGTMGWVVQRDGDGPGPGHKPNETEGGGAVLAPG